MNTVDLENKCDTCKNEFATCHPVDIQFGIDLDPTATGADADIVLECGAYQHE